MTNLTGTGTSDEMERNSDGPVFQDLVRCPACRSPLSPAAPSADDVDRLRCTGCGTGWPVRWGIPDLRPPGIGDPYITLDDDLRAAEKLVRRAEETDAAGVLATYYESNALVPAAQVRRFTLGALAARGRAEGVLRAWRSLSGLGERGLTLIDLGCGTGPLCVAAMEAGFLPVGLDVGLRWLVIARTRARDAGRRLTTVCAGAGRLPFADHAVDVVASEYLLENVVPADSVLAESVRVLRSGGRFWCATANRWSVGPDPHLGIPFSGWWPAPIVHRVARLRRAVPPQRRLLSAGELRQALARHGFADVHVAPSPIAESQRAGASAPVRVAVDAYGLVARTAAGRGVLKRVGPSLVATGRAGGHAPAS